MGERGFLIDLDGVLYTGSHAIEGAQEAVHLLESRGCPFRFLSNSTRRSRAGIVQHLQSMGFSINPTLIFTPALAAAAFIRQSGKCRCMLLTTGDVNRDFEEHGIILPKTGPVDHVVVGDAGDAVTYETLNRAFRLVNDGAGLIALEKDRFWMGPDGLLLSAGPIVAALEYATGKSATVMGKPSPDFFGSALAAMGLSTADVTMIGDDIITDIAGARSAGIDR